MTLLEVSWLSREFLPVEIGEALDEWLYQYTDMAPEGDKNVTAIRIGEGYVEIDIKDEPMRSFKVPVPPPIQVLTYLSRCKSIEIMDTFYLGSDEIVDAQPT